ncbi:MAG TPA: MFS transporter [candidate division Zixibacteria bacterium]|jgi:MFS family permease
MMTVQTDQSTRPTVAAESKAEAEVSVAPSHWLREYIRNLRSISVAARWYLIGSFLVGLAWLTFMLLFNLYMKERGFSETVIGRILSAQSFGTVAMAIPGALLVSRVSPRILLILSSLGVAAGFALQVRSDGADAILAAAFAAGAMLAFSRVTSSPFLMMYSSPAERAHVFSLGFAAMLGAGLVAHFGAGTLHRALTAPAGSSVQAYRWVLWIGSASAAMAVFAYAKIPSAVVGRRSLRVPWRQYWSTRGRLLFRLTFPFFLVGLGAGLIIPFMNLYFRDRFGLPTQTIGIYYGFVQLSMIIGVMIGPELARRYGMVRTIVATELASIPFMLVLAFSRNLPLVTAAFLCRGGLMNLGVPITNNYMMERVGESDRALANSWSMVAWTLSWALTAALGGWMIERWGYEVPLLLACGLYIAASWVYWFYFANFEIYAGRSAVGVVRPGDE